MKLVDADLMQEIVKHDYEECISVLNESSDRDLIDQFTNTYNIFSAWIDVQSEVKKWIPAAISKPTKEDMYLCAWLPNSFDSKPYPHYYGLFEYADGEFDMSSIHAMHKTGGTVIAWMPLPDYFTGNKGV